VRVVPYLLIIMILVGGIVVAFQTYNEETGESQSLLARPTVTPRPWPTSPPRPPSPTFNAEPFQPLESNQANVVPGLQPPTSALPAQPGGSEASPTPAPGAPTQTPVTPSQGTPGAATATPAAATDATLYVGNTGGEGVYIRATPRMDDTLRPWADNTPMVVIGPRIEGDGHMWERVRAPDGSEGYIPSEYLVGRP
jgi:hypothetical protein